MTYLIYIYCSSVPPSRIKLDIKIDSVEPLQMYAVCTVYNSNPVCMAKIVAERETIIGSERKSLNLTQPHRAWNSQYAVNLNVRQEDKGAFVKCVVKCEDFPDLDLTDTSMIVIPCKLKHTKQTRALHLEIKALRVLFRKNVESTSNYVAYGL